MARDLVGPDVRLYWDQSVFKQPNGAEPVLWHQDNGYTYVEPQAYLTCWLAITDATPENGCIAVMPGVHRDGTLAHRSTPVGEECWGDWSAAVEVPVRAGSIVVFTSLTPHATKRNTTNDVRKAYIVQYAPDGAVAHFGDPAAGPPTRDRECSATTSGATGSCATAPESNRRQCIEPETDERAPTRAGRRHLQGMSDIIIASGSSTSST